MFNREKFFEHYMSMSAHQIAATQMFFLMEGMLDAAKREATPEPSTLYRRIYLESRDGAIEFVENLSPIIDTLTACVLAGIERNSGDFPGIFEYEVTAIIGDILYTENYRSSTRFSEDYRAICEQAVERAHTFFNQMEDTQLPFEDFSSAVKRYEAALVRGSWVHPTCASDPAREEHF